MLGNLSPEQLKVPEAICVSEDVWVYYPSEFTMKDFPVFTKYVGYLVMHYPSVYKLKYAQVGKKYTQCTKRVYST